MDMTITGVTGKTKMTIVEASTIFPGFRFSPTDEELISYYLKKKMEGSEKGVEIISMIEIWKYEPWDLPAKSVVQSDNEWFFFSPRGRKYPNGSQSKRATELGYWKATGKERNVKSGSNVIGTKRTLVFHIGRAPKGERTEWIMHEYCLNGNSQDSLVVCRLRKNSDFHLNDTLNPASRSRKRLSAMNNNSSSSEVGINQTGVSEGALGISEGDRAAECSSKRCISSNDSHSIEQIESATESNAKLSNEVSKPGCSSHQNCDDDKDFYAEILKDDIIKLDEFSKPSISHRLQPTVTNTSEVERKSNQPMVPVQGTAHRRIKLKKQRYDSEEELKISESKQSGKLSCWVVMVVVFVSLTLLLMILSLFGGLPQVKIISCASSV